MKKLFFIAVLFLFSNLTNAQDFAPIGATWHYDYVNWAIQGYTKIESIADTTIDDIICKKLHTTLELYSFISEEFVTYDAGYDYVYNDEDKVYLYRNGLFYTLYDFSAGIGESWMVPNNQDIPFEECDTVGMVEVLDKGDTIIMGNNYRYVFVQGQEEYEPWALSGLIIEGFGAVEYYFYPEPGCMTDSNEGGTFRCYSDESIELSAGNVACDYITGTDEIISHSTTIQLFYSSNGIDFKSKNNHIISSIKINDISGKLIKDYQPMQSDFHLGFDLLPSGVYIYSIEINGKTERGKVIFP